MWKIFMVALMAAGLLAGGPALGQDAARLDEFGYAKTWFETEGKIRLPLAEALTGDGADHLRFIIDSAIIDGDVVLDFRREKAGRMRLRVVAVGRPAVEFAIAQPTGGYMWAEAEAASAAMEVWAAEVRECQRAAGDVRAALWQCVHPREGEVTCFDPDGRFLEIIDAQGVRRWEGGGCISNQVDNVFGLAMRMAIQALPECKPLAFRAAEEIVACLKLAGDRKAAMEVLKIEQLFSPPPDSSGVLALIRSNFSEDVVYRERGRAPVRGLAAVERLWAEREEHSFAWAIPQTYRGIGPSRVKVTGSFKSEGLEERDGLILEERAAFSLTWVLADERWRIAEFTLDKPYWRTSTDRPST